MAKKHTYGLPPDHDKRVRLKQIEELMASWQASGRLWDSEDSYVTETLSEYDRLFKEVNPHMAGMSYHDMKEADWDKIDAEVAKEIERQAEEEGQDPSTAGEIYQALKEKSKDG